MDKLNHIFKSRYITSISKSDIDLPVVTIAIYGIYDHFYGLDLGNLNPARIEYWANQIINYYKENEEFKNIPYHKAEVFDNTLILYKKEKETDPEYGLVKVASLKYNFTDYIVFDLNRKKFFIIPKYMIELLFDDITDLYNTPPMFDN